MRRRDRSQEIQGGWWRFGVLGVERLGVEVGTARPYSQKGILLFLPYTRISSTIYLFKPPPRLFLGVVCHVNFARLREGGRAGLLTHYHPVPRFLPHSPVSRLRSVPATRRRDVARRRLSCPPTLHPTHPSPIPSMIEEREKK